MGARLFYMPRATAFDAAANVEPGAKLYFYETGTTTDKTVYQDDDLTTPHAQPVVANSAGNFAPIYLDTGEEYKAVLDTADDVELWAVDPIPTRTVSTADYAANSVDLAAMEHGTQGQILFYGSSGTPTRLSAGTSGHPLVTKGAGSNPAFEQVDTVGIADGAVETAKIEDNAVTLAKLADGTQGGIIYYGASGAPTELAAGTSGQFLKTQGASANPTWATALFQESYDSGDQTISQAGQLTLAHSLSGKPRIVLFALKCTDAAGEANYAQNDEIIWGVDDHGDGTNTRGFSAQIDATNVTIRFVNEANVFTITDATSGNSVNLTNTKWALIVRAYF